MNIKDKQTGRFVRRLRVWTPELWDEGWFDNRGRFRVYRPDYPKAFPGGYALRTHIVWWLVTGNCPPSGFSLHHLNEIKSDDRFENLSLMPSGRHAALHNSKEPLICICSHCNKEFRVPLWRVNERKKTGETLPKFCSQVCYHAHEKSQETRKKMSESLKLAWATGHRNR